MSCFKKQRVWPGIYPTAPTKFLVTSLSFFHSPNFFFFYGKASACNAGDLGSNPGLGRSPGEDPLPTPVLLPGKFHGLRSLVGYSPWGHKESDTTEQLHFHRVLSQGDTKIIIIISQITCPQGTCIVPKQKDLAHCRDTIQFCFQHILLILSPSNLILYSSLS